jgi:pilus assembly protein CpaF
VIISWDLILPFLKPIEPLLRDPDVSDILVNGSSAVFVERAGCLELVHGVVIAEKPLKVAIRNIARLLGDDVSEEKPLLDARLPDGSRLSAVFAPCSVGGTTLAIRKFQTKRYQAEALVRLGTLTPDVLATLRRAVEERQNLLISGGTGSGKTTLLNALAAFIPDDERIVVIEDTSEIQIDKPDIVRLEARRDQPGWPAITIRDLLKVSLRLRPDRIVVGEIRGSEAFDFLQALNTGHAGTLSTIHAISAPHAIQRLTTCVLQAGIELPYRAVRCAIADSLHIVMQLARRRDGKRLVTEVASIRGYDPDADRYAFDVLYAAPPEKRMERKDRSMST